MKVLLAVVGDLGTCSLGFAVSMLRLQSALQNSPVAIQAMMEIVPSLRAALALAQKDAEIKAVVAIRSTLTFPVGFVLRALSSGKPFTAGIYPLPKIDWERVKAKVGSGESPEFRGNVYNVDASKASSVVKGIMEVTDIEPGAVILTREAIDAVHAKAPKTDEDVPSAWGRTIYADVEQQCANFGPAEFFGCVGLRSVLR